MASTPAPQDPCASTGPLNGIRVLDLTSVVLGPLATQILGDYGADVIKIESIEGDLMRANGVSVNRGMGSIFLTINRNKRSIALDLKSAAGAKVLARLVRDADVLVHNMRVPAIERLGFGYDAVRAIKPSIVYVVATGFGQDGPDRDKPAFDDIIQAGCGMAALNGINFGEPDYAPSLIADKTTGMAVVNAVLAALFHRERTRRGQFVEVPMLETMTAYVLSEHMGGLTFEPRPARAGYSRLLSGGRKPARTRDGHISMLPYTTAHWESFFIEAGRADLLEKYKLADRHDRNANVRNLYADLRSISPSRTTTEWLEVCARLDIPATPIYALDDLPGHPHLKAVGLFDVVVHPTEGNIRTMRPTTLFSETPADVRRQAPLLGQHTGEILREAGYSDDEIDALVRDGIAFTEDRAGA